MSVIIDIKTGKAPWWAGYQLAAQSLINDFNVIFEPSGHTYTYNGQTLPSITGILKAEGFIDTQWYDNWSRDRGSYVHLACHYDINGELDEETLDEEIRPYLAAFRKFMADSGFKVERSEVPGVNTTYLYAGTPDLVGCFPQPTAARRYVLELNNEAKYKLIPYADPKDAGIFLAAVTVYQIKKQHMKG